MGWLLGFRSVWKEELCGVGVSTWQDSGGMGKATTKGAPAPNAGIFACVPHHERHCNHSMPLPDTRIPPWMGVKGPTLLGEVVDVC